MKLGDNKIGSVLILRPDNLGDVILFSGALRHLRAYYPQAVITVCVKRYVSNLLELCPHIDRIVHWEDVQDLLPNWIPRIRGRGPLQAIANRLFLRFKFQNDIILLPVRSPVGGRHGMHAIVRDLSSCFKYGIAGGFTNLSEDKDRAVANIYTKRLMLDDDQRYKHEINITREFLGFIGINVSLADLWPEFWTDEHDKRWAEDHVVCRPKTMTLALCPGAASSPVKLYPDNSYLEAIGSIADVEFNVIVFGEKSEKGQCANVVSTLVNCKNVTSIKNLAGESTIRQTVEGLRRCDVVLSLDTAALHIGVALKKPTVGILGGGNYERFYPWGDSSINRVANIPMDCYGCNWKCRYSHVRCIQDIPPEKIAKELKVITNAMDLINN